MVSDFDKCLEFVLKMEGGFSNNPSDHGGATNKGIIQSEYDAYRTSHGLPTQSVKLISNVEAATIYRVGYWNEIHGDYISMPLCMALFDTAVNCGVGRAYEFFNDALGLGRVMVWSNQTSQSYHGLDQASMCRTAEQVLTFRKEFYERISQNPGQSQFLQGWLNRLICLRQAAGI